MVEKCNHDSGWVAVQKHRIFLTHNKDVLFGKELNEWQSVLCRCNKKSCSAKRKLYFDKDGKFVKFGRIINLDALNVKEVVA